MPGDFKPRNKAFIPLPKPDEGERKPRFIPKGIVGGGIDGLVDQMRNDDLVRPLARKEQMFPPPKQGNVSYLRQIAEADGLQTCYPTSLLNAWIHQGAITPAEAQGIQDRFRSDLRRLFMKVPLSDYHTLAQNPYEFTKLVGSELRKAPRMYNMNVGRLDAESMEKIILQEINKGNLLVVGDDVHARLVIGYKNNGQALEMCDPLTPQSIRTKNTRAVAQVIAGTSDHWMAIVPTDL